MGATGDVSIVRKFTEVNALILQSPKRRQHKEQCRRMHQGQWWIQGMFTDVDSVGSESSIPAGTRMFTDMNIPGLHRVGW
ncbi:hypothetical protein PoB_001921100 [Plakobranchus ocellatus]|uniref:Uncharacterized protein n=1 Tax=Plakobranchus ocellatus TaxID=259542 RepID=A0AAV3Z072_9GAST|nr:hypothetical protein PoB_001921100 [Plakobranchus ocellatus]